MFKLISLNVRGISNFKKRKMIFTWCRKKKADIIFLQETHSKKDASGFLLRALFKGRVVFPMQNR